MSKAGTLSSTGITRFHRYYDPLRSPKQPCLALASCRLVPIFRFHCWGFPCSVCLPIHACRRQYPGKSNGSCSLVLLHQRRPSPILRRVSSCVNSFEACSTFIRITTCMFTEPLKRPFTSKAPAIFFTSIAASIATGWSEPVPGWVYLPLRSTGLSRRT